MNQLGILEGTQHLQWSQIRCNEVLLESLHAEEYVSSLYIDHRRINMYLLLWLNVHLSITTLVVDRISNDKRSQRRTAQVFLSIELKNPNPARTAPPLALSGRDSVSSFSLNFSRRGMPLRVRSAWMGNKGYRQDDARGV